MKTRILGQTPRFWLIVLALFVVTQVLFSFGGQNDAPDWLNRIGGNFTQRVIISAATMAIVSLGLNLIYGFNGQFSLGQWGFYALGAYSSADITYRWVNDHDAGGLVFALTLVLALAGLYSLTSALVRQRLLFLDEISRFTLYLAATGIGAGAAIALAALLGPAASAGLGLLGPDLSVQLAFVLATLCGGGIAALFSFLFGQSVLKLGGDYFGIATLGLTMVVYVLANNSDKVFTEMKGSRGMVGIPTVTTWVWAFVFLVLVLIVVRNLLDSSHGRAVVAVREDEVAARAMGINTTDYKMLAFVVGSFFAGLAGSLYAHQEGFLHPSTFHFIQAFNPLIIIVFGGLGSLTGTVVAAFVWALTLNYILPWLLGLPGMPSDALAWRFVVYPVALLLIMLLRQQGLLGGIELGFLKPMRWPLRPKGEGADAERARARAIPVSLGMAWTLALLFGVLYEVAASTQLVNLLTVPHVAAASDAGLWLTNPQLATLLTVLQITVGGGLVVALIGYLAGLLIQRFERPAAPVASAQPTIGPQAPLGGSPAQGAE